MKALIILNHNPVEELLIDLKENYGVENIEILKETNENLALKFGQIPITLKTKKELYDYIVKEMVSFVKERNYKVVVISGEPVVCKWVTIELEKLGINCYAPLSKRESVDVKQSDGLVVKKAIFKYAGLREF